MLICIFPPFAYVLLICHCMIIFVARTWVFSVARIYEPRTLKMLYPGFYGWRTFSQGTQTSHTCVGGGEGEKREREVACSPGLSGSFILLLRYYLWRGAEGRAAASHSSSHDHAKNAISCHLVTNNTSNTSDIFSSERRRWQTFSPQASKHESLPPIKTVKSDDHYRGFGDTRNVFTIQMAQMLLKMYQQTSHMHHSICQNINTRRSTSK